MSTILSLQCQNLQLKDHNLPDQCHHNNLDLLKCRPLKLWPNYGHDRHLLLLVLLLNRHEKTRKSNKKCRKRYLKTSQNSLNLMKTHNNRTLLKNNPKKNQNNQKKKRNSLKRKQNNQKMKRMKVIRLVLRENVQNLLRILKSPVNETKMSLKMKISVSDVNVC